MISILILTDDVSIWTNKFQSCLSALHEHKTEDGCYLENPMFKVTIKKMLRGLEKEKKYTHIIVDKYISKDYEKEVLRPKISNPVIYERGYFKDWQERVMLEQQKGYMKTCRDCIHYEVCKQHNATYHASRLTLENDASERCYLFSDNNKYSQDNDVSKLKAKKDD